MKMLVLRKAPESAYGINCHECKVDGQCEPMRVDLWVDGSLTQEEYDNLIGKTVECEYTFPYISIAMGVRIVADKKEAGN